jgi:hypothetical protein
LGAYFDSNAPEFGFSTLWLVNTPKLATQHAVFMIQTCRPQTWEQVGVMASGVKMLDVGGIGAGKLQLGSLKKA